MATASHQEIEDLRRKMALIRHDLHQDVRSVVEGAEAAADWRRYVRSYPWLGVGLAFAVGFLLVPRRLRATNTTTINYAPAEIARSVAAEVPKILPAAALPEKKKSNGLIKSALGLAMPVVLRAAQGYALQFFEQWMAQKMAQQPHNMGGLEGLASLLGAAGQQPQQPHPAPPQGMPTRPPGGPRF